MEKSRKIAAISAVLHYIEKEKSFLLHDKSSASKSRTSDNSVSSAWKMFGRNLNFKVKQLIQLKSYK